MADVAFLVLSVLAVASAILALETEEIVYGAISLMIMSVAVAGFFILLDAPFVAMFQIIVYVGAVAVLILFTVMLVKREKWIKTEVKGMQAAGILGGLTLAFSIGLLLVQSILGSVYVSPDEVSFIEVGIQMISEYWFALEVLALLLAASLIGALTLARVEKED